MENKQDSVLNNNSTLTMLKELFKKHPSKEFIGLNELMKGIPKRKVKALYTQEEVKLGNCPVGLFLYGKTLCMKTEYYSTNGNPECYIVSSGETFCASQEPDFNSILVTPLLEK